MVHTRDLQPRSSRWLVDTVNRLSRVDIPTGMHTVYSYDPSAHRIGISAFLQSQNGA